MPITIETPRLRLRSLTLDDAPDVFMYTSDPDIAQQIHWQPTTSLKQTQQLLYTLLEYHPFAWGIEHKCTNNIIGECGFIHVNKTSAELYYAIARDYWGAGFACEATAALTTFGLTELQLIRIEAWILSSNQPSQRVAQKIGMHLKRTIENQWYTQKHMHDILIYTLEQKNS